MVRENGGSVLIPEDTQSAGLVIGAWHACMEWRPRCALSGSQRDGLVALAQYSFRSAILASHPSRSAPFWIRNNPVADQPATMLTS